MVGGRDYDDSKRDDENDGDGHDGEDDAEADSMSMVNTNDDDGADNDDGSVDPDEKGMAGCRTARRCFSWFAFLLECCGLAVRVWLQESR